MAFTEEDKERLKLYLTKCEEMVNSSFIKNAPRELNINVNLKEGKFTANWPEEESVKAFLMAFRHFYKQGDSKEVNLNFSNICDLLYKNITDERIKKEIAKVRECYTKSLRAFSGFECNNKRLTIKDIIKVHLYGDYFHTDKNKRTLIEGIAFRSLIKHGFIYTLYGLARCINYIGSIIRDVLDGKIGIDC